MILDTVKCCALGRGDSPNENQNKHRYLRGKQKECIKQKWEQKQKTQIMTCRHKMSLKRENKMIT